ncbi:hypothetical protein [Yersinia mollaretii]|uniref:hypothetical protein n=2 Tax=Yersinia mollaretii TaxID=33060 RepID=UPI00067DEA1E|nr:hypothetical protein [Yersinia mollaretii]MDN0111787.1 hypothetical protein [Yersinia mollaretii]PJE88087.1 hypothetical protein CU280_10175 [Yersinia mollaretii]
MKMKTKLSLVLLLVMMVVFLAYLGWRSLPQQSEFECRARMHAKLIANDCNKNSVVDIFLSIHNDGTGYLLASGTHSCPKTAIKSIRGIIDFTYRKEGRYYAIHMSKRSPDMLEIFNGLKNDDIKVKVTKVNNNDYIISSPIETFMMCTKESLG